MQARATVIALPYVRNGKVKLCRHIHDKLLIFIVFACMLKVLEYADKKCRSVFVFGILLQLPFALGYITMPASSNLQIIAI